MLAATSSTVTGRSKCFWLPSGNVITGMKLLVHVVNEKGRSRRETALRRSGRRGWDRTSDHHHVKVMLYH